MSSKTPVLTADLIKLLKIFLGAAGALVLVLSFFDGHRANNTGAAKSFQIADADGLFFINLRSIHYDRELRPEAQMEIFRHRKRPATASRPSFFPGIIRANQKKEAYLFFELEGVDYPFQLRVTLADEVIQLPVNLGGNASHKDLGEQLWPFLQQNASFTCWVAGKEYPLWQTESEKEVLKTVLNDYFRMLNQPLP